MAGYTLNSMKKCIITLLFIAFSASVFAQGIPPVVQTNIVRLDQKVLLEWEKNPEPDIAGYFVQMLTGGELSERFTTNTFIPVLSMRPGMTNGPHSFRVFAVNTLGVRSEPSAILTTNLVRPPSIVVKVRFSTEVTME